MPSLADAPSTALDTQVADGLNSALGKMGKSLASKVNAVITSQLKREATDEALQKAVRDKVPDLVAKEFLGSFLKYTTDSRQHRAVLMLALALVDAHGEGAGPIVVRSSEAPADDGEELTSEEAAQLLRVSRTHLNSLLDSGKLGEVIRTAGGHRRVSKAAVLRYKADSKARQSRGLDEMTEATARLGLYDKELEGIPRRTPRRVKR